jgi:hypothetical protein
MKSLSQFALFGFGGAICVLNFYLSFVRGLRFCIARRKSEYRFISGLPLIGFLCVVTSLILFRMPRWAWVAGIVLALADTGGIHWFFGTMAWKSRDHAFRFRH